MKTSYDKSADTYDKGRPSYPKEVMDWIIDKTRMDTHHQLLEIAPGTGQATLEFASRGYSIKCVELGKNLSDILRRKVVNMDVSVDVSSFEGWQHDSDKVFDYIYCATAFHWLDPKLKYKKCSQLLTDEGRLILIWNVFSESKYAIIKKAYDMLWAYCPDKKHISSEVLKMRRKDDIDASKEFILEDYLDYKWQLSSSKEETIQGFYSQSSYLSLEDKDKSVLNDKLDLLFENLDEKLVSDVSTTVYICKRS